MTASTITIARMYRSSLGTASLLLALLLSPPLPADAAAPPPPPTALRITGPQTLAPGTLHLIRIEAQYPGTTYFQPIKEAALKTTPFTAAVTGSAKLVVDPAGVQMNPITLDTREAKTGDTVELTVRQFGLQATRKFSIAPAAPACTFTATIDPARVLHRFDGLGAGVLFYDNQFDITSGPEILDWCFRDLHASFLHLLLRHTYEPANDNDDPHRLDLSRFDFTPLERPLRIAREALKRNPKLRIYASLYTPPTWMKEGGSASGSSTLKAGPQIRAELAEYLLAALKHMKQNGVPVDDLAIFNEPDFPHTQDGMFMPDLVTLAQTFAAVSTDLKQMMAADPDLRDHPVRFVFPDTLGPGSITRAGNKTQQLRAHAADLANVDVWGVHDYWNTGGNYWQDRYRELRAFGPVGRKPIWMTEWAQRYRRGDLASGVEYAQKMLNALRLGAQAWMVFEWCHPSGNQSGLISTDWSATPPRQRYWRSKAYFVFQQIANTSTPGAQVVQMTARSQGPDLPPGAVEYLALREGRTVIVHMSSDRDAPVRFELRCPGVNASATVIGFATTALENMHPLSPSALQVQNGRITGELPPYALVTLQIPLDQ